MTVTRIDRLTPEQEARMGEWADRWIEIGLRTGTTDWDRFEMAARDCYKHANIPWPDRVIHVSSPIVGAFAAPTANYIIQLLRGGAVGGAVDGAVRDAVDGAVRGAVGGAVRGAVGDAVGGAVRGAVHDAVDEREVWEVISRTWSQILGGQFWAGGWWWGGASTSFFREVCDLALPNGLWDRGRAYEATIESACWWWPCREFVMVCARPTEIHLEQVAPRGWGSHRLHCETGPAVVWPDGWGVYAWHGTRVPADLIEEGWSYERILAEPNAEVRRAAIEICGWDRFIVDAGLVLVDSADDPGNPGQRIELYDVPAAIYEEPVRVLLCTNGTAERSGERRRFGLTVPADVPDAVSAGAWTYGIDRKQYAQLARRT